MHILSLITDNNPSGIGGREENGHLYYFMINLRENIEPDRDQTHDPWISCQTRYQLPYAAQYKVDSKYSEVLTWLTVSTVESELKVKVGIVESELS